MSLFKFLIPLCICFSGHFAFASEYAFMGRSGPKHTSSQTTQSTARPETTRLEVKIGNLQFRRTACFRSQCRNVTRTFRRGEVLEVVANYARYYKVRANQRIVNGQLRYEEGYVWKSNRFLKRLNPAATSTSNPSLQSSTPTRLANTPSGEILMPLCGCTSPGCRGTSNYGRRWGRAHTGTDFAAPHGTPIRAAADGIVSRAPCGSGYGICLIIDHNSSLKDNRGRTVSTRGFKTLYSHMSRKRVSPGQRVQKGDIIGYIGRTGNATGNSTHFEIRANDRRLNPATFFPRGLIDKGARYPACPRTGTNNNETRTVR